MARIVTYTIVMTCVFILSSLAGFNSIGTNFLSCIGYTQGDATLGCFNSGAGSIATIFSLGAGAAIITIGIITGLAPESYLMFGLCATLLSISISGFMDIINLMKTYPAFVFGIIGTLYFMLVAGYFISIVQFWRGNDI